VVVTGDAVYRGKPHPEPYLHAARLLGVDPARCLAIEDSNTGAQSAEAAGCLVLVVENHVLVEPGKRRLLLRTLSGVTAADLLAIDPVDDPADQTAGGS
jgi:beta-phosphoglucomutase-like phosphatase (HAD superfamily)